MHLLEEWRIADIERKVSRLEQNSHLGCEVDGLRRDVQHMRDQLRQCESRVDGLIQENCELRDRLNQVETLQQEAQNAANPTH